LTVAIGAMVRPQELLNQESLAGGLALIPALLLAHYRGWMTVSAALGVGLVALCALNLAPTYLGVSFSALPVPLVLAPYVAIALGAGWFGEVRRYQAELRATQLQLIQSEKLDSIGRMAAGIAHEVKNPLMMILTGVKILSKRSSAADESTRLLLQDMADAVNRADKIIGGLLSYSRNRGLDVAPTDLGATIEKSLLLVKHELDTNRIAVVKELDPALPELSLDEFKIQQVFVNLFTNALHAMEHDGEITVRASIEPLARGASAIAIPISSGRRQAVVVRIGDTGRDPAPSGETTIRSSPPPTGKGTGLGLSVSRQIVEMHGGAVEIGNRDGGGARVTLIFKLGHNGAHHGETTQHKETAHSARG
jgi:signal transduction histidine kinase